MVRCELAEECCVCSVPPWKCPMIKREWDDDEIDLQDESGDTEI